MLPDTAPLPGLPIPEMLLAPADGDSRTLHERCAGRRSLLVLGGDAALLHALARLAPQTLVIALGGAPGDWPFTQRRDDNGTLCRRWLQHLNAATFALPVLLNVEPNLRIRQAFAAATADDLAHLDMPPSLPAVPLQHAAPVLCIPDVVPASLCQALIQAHDTDHHDSGLLRRRNTTTALVPDYRIKRRRDHALAIPALTERVTDALRQRVLPLVQQAFTFPVTQLEGYKVVAYHGGEQGHFALHRDNTSPDTRHRRLALSLLLSDDYDGGELVFPEFSAAGVGAARYRPAAGSAVVFSGSLLHGVQPVTRGRRDVLLTFLW